MSLFLELIWAHLWKLIMKRDIAILGEGPAKGLNDTTLTAESIDPINLTQPNERFV